jgi:hypothetical protein
MLCWCASALLNALQGLQEELFHAAQQMCAEGVEIVLPTGQHTKRLRLTGSSVQALGNALREHGISRAVEKQLLDVAAKSTHGIH